MSYQFITEHSATFYHPRPPGHRYRGVCVHHWGDPAQRPTFESTINYLVYGGASRTASVHYVAEAGRVACLLDPDTQLSWGQGDGAYGEGNNYYLSLELNPRASDGDYQTASELIRELRAAFGNLPLRPHNYFTATQCPGVWDLARLDRLARESPAPAPVATPLQEDNMLIIGKEKDDPDVWIGDGITRRHIGGDELLKSYQWMAANGWMKIYADGAIQTIQPSIDVLGLDLAALVRPGQG
jgi:hypothetical protein